MPNRLNSTGEQAYIRSSFAKVNEIETIFIKEEISL